MTTTGAAATLWTARLAATGMALFLALFALDAFTGKSLTAGLPDFLIHLAPSLLVLGVVAASWRHPLIGAAAFTCFALGYAVMVRGRLDWIVAIALPLAVVALLFFASWQFAPSASQPR